MKDVSRDFRKDTSALILRFLKESQPGLSDRDICCIASTFYMDCLKRKNDNKTAKVERTPLTYRKEQK